MGVIIAVTDEIDISTLYERLNQIGLSYDFVRENGLPEWWTEECDRLPDAPITAATYLSRRFNLEFNSLVRPENEPAFQQSNKTCYKTANGSVSTELNIASNLALRVAELSVYAYPKEYQSIKGLTAHEIRKRLLDQEHIVNLENLLNFCHAYGILVIHFNNFPKTVKKFFGMVTRCSRNPVIVLSLQDLSPSRLAFILAHELGHIALNHLEEGQAISDEVIKFEDIEDDEESAANEFAAELVLGEPDKCYFFSQYMTAEKLANVAYKKAERDRNDPSAIAWNYGWYNKKHFGVARNAVKLIEKDADAPQIINQRLTQYLVWDRLSEDNQEYLALALKLSEEARLA